MICRRSSLLISELAILSAIACGGTPAAEQPLDSSRGGSTNFFVGSGGSAATGNVAGAQQADPCGNGKQESGESCDDANRTPGDGCNGNCQIEYGYEC
ncbi:MAG TPA: hypothetical protein VKP30_05200, partial [Polyangiaceae bacterium]|nr:hypothetical protein [Polyangiaceae bacterium]